MDRAFNCETVEGLMKQLASLPPDTRIATAEYYYDIQEGVAEGLDDTQMVYHEGVLYFDCNGVQMNELTGKPCYILR